MSYAALATVNPGDVISTTWGNQVRDNFAGSPNALAAAAGDTFYATAANALAKLTAGAQGALLRMGAGAAPNWLAKGTGLQYLRVNGGGTDLEYATLFTDPHVEAKETAGNTGYESVTWTVAYATAPVIVVSTFDTIPGDTYAIVSARSTTGATVLSMNPNGVRSIVKMVHARAIS